MRGKPIHLDVVSLYYCVQKFVPLCSSSGADYGRCVQDALNEQLQAAGKARLRRFMKTDEGLGVRASCCSGAE